MAIEQIQGLTRRRFGSVEPLTETTLPSKAIQSVAPVSISDPGMSTENLLERQNVVYSIEGPVPPRRPAGGMLNSVA